MVDLSVDLHECDDCHLIFGAEERFDILCCAGCGSGELTLVAKARITDIVEH